MGNPLTCAKARQRIEEAMVGALGEGERRELEAHLAGCPSCLGTWRWEQLLHRATKEWPLPEPSPRLAWRIIIRLRQEEEAVTPLAERAAKVALGVLCVMTLAGAWWVGQSPPSWLAPLGEFLRAMGEALAEEGRRWGGGLAFLWEAWRGWNRPWVSLAPWALLILLALQGWGLWRMRGALGNQPR